MKDHPIKVRFNANGTPECFPIETAGVQRGDTLTWSGEAHSGVFEGKVLGAKQKNFNAQDLPNLQVDNTKIPVQPATWNSAAPTLTVKANAEFGAYKYSVTVGNHTVDPIVLIEP